MYSFMDLIGVQQLTQLSIKITLARVNDNVTLTLWWYSGTWINACGPNWLLLSPFVVLPAVVGLILVVNGLTRAKGIDSDDLS
ncbi:MAG: hypothetical protein C4K49_12780 [Candidatus Thorarchaeota archaeon]|nr:MAG: hypothetical protein C4K49_12780 [Candidatus Thorarchaeota archaeon]